MPLLLFDIDGTLVNVTGGVHSAVSHAIDTVTGRSVCTDGVTFAGRTDPAIFSDVLQASGVPDPPAVLNDVLHTYAECAQDTIEATDVDVLPGVRPLLSALSRRPDVRLGLVTGNIESVAHHKLRRAELGSHFSVGAFGSDHANRNELPPMAVRRASSQGRTSFSVRDTIVIGDTQHDIRCARASGTRVAAVCTGTYARDDLHVHTPDFLFETLQDTQAVVEKLLGS
ncbi:MAG: HAD family hydrolase [Bacteroidetes bacterium SW_9_63_38]|nr:MAG: HAD family hydrolase [Bacteroidetes bacterium SW_9_63_38]